MAEKRVALLKRANKLFRQGKADAAVKEYQKILALKPDDLEVRRIVGDLQLRENNLPDAIVQFEWIADYYLKEGFFAKAIAMYKRITRVDPNYEGALYKLAELYTKQGLVMEAKQIYLDIAEECKRQNNQKKALDMYKKILEFDRSNIKMRLLLADNYLKEGEEEKAVNEYLIAADILVQKKDFQRVEELLRNTLKKSKHVKIIEKLVRFFTTQEQDTKAIEVLSSLGDELYQHGDLMKMLGELYLKLNMMTEAEQIFTKVAQVNPEEAEVIMRLGKVYLQRGEYESTFNLFLPIVEKNVAEKKFEEAASLLRFIIASNNTFLPALTKLASIFKLSGKTNNLIALYESLIPIYEQKGMIDQLKKILEELIQLSDTPFTYEELLAKLTGREAEQLEEAEQEKQNEREREFVNYNLRLAEEALGVSDIGKAITVLKKAKSSFPKNIDVRERLFQIYLQDEQNEPAVEEGKGLLELYKRFEKSLEYSDMVEKLSTLRPHDDSLVTLSENEKTSIDIDFDREELEEQLQEMHAPSYQTDAGLPEEDVLLLSDADSLPPPPPPPLQAEAEAEFVAKSNASYESSKSLSSVLSEVDFYVNDGYFGDAEKLIEQLKKKYPGNQALLEKIEKLNQAKVSVKKKEDTGLTGSSFEIEHEGLGVETFEPPASEDVKEHTERIHAPEAGSEEFIIEHSHAGQTPAQDIPLIHQSQDSNVEIDLGDFDMGVQPEESSALDLADDHMLADSSLSLEPEPVTMPEPQKEQTGGDVFGLDDFDAPEPQIIDEGEEGPMEIDLGEIDTGAQMYEESDGLRLGDSDLGMPEPFGEPLQPEMLEPEAPSSPPPPLDDSFFEITSSIAQESTSAQEHEDSKIDIKINPNELVKAQPEKDDGIPVELESNDLEIEMEEPVDTDDFILEDSDIDRDLLIQSPSVDSSKKGDTGSQTSSVIDELDLDSIIEKEDSVYDLDSPFKDDMSGTDLAFESEEDLLQGEGFFFDDDLYLEIEKNVALEKEVINIWLKELEKQRTSTIEKNMMEIFEEFKKGVDEKIGQEDYDTRYNLGIAYKEMGLLEEAIHEFLISSKHPLKFFDSAGLLGMCFRDKGMFSEAVNWFERAMGAPDRRQEEYLAIRFELAVTFKLKEDYTKALKVCAEIIKADPGFRNVIELYKEIQPLAAAAKKEETHH